MSMVAIHCMYVDMYCWIAFRVHYMVVYAPVCVVNESHFHFNLYNAKLERKRLRWRP